MYYHDQSEGSGGSKALYPNTQGVADVRWVAIYRIDESAFKFDSIWIGANFGDGTMSFYGFSGVVDVSGSPNSGAIGSITGFTPDYSKTNVDISSDGSVAFTGWDNVNTVIFTCANDMFCLFDDFT